MALAVGLWGNVVSHVDKVNQCCTSLFSWIGDCR